MTHASVAIITRTKDRDVLLPRVLASIINQSYKDFSWVIVNDAGARKPVDDIAQKAREQHVDVHVIHREASSGMEAASNAGCRSISSKYIVIHDDDDSWEPTFLEKTVAFLEEHQDMVGVVTRAMKISEKIEDGTCTFLSQEPFNDWLKAVYLIDMAQRNQFPPISFLFRRALYEKVGGFNEELRVLGDWEFALKLLWEGDIGFIPEYLSNYHLRPASHQPKDQYANTVTHYHDEHAYYDAYIRNYWLRKDLKDGKFSLGSLLSLGRQHFSMWSVLKVFRKRNIETDEVA